MVMYSSLLLKQRMGSRSDLLMKEVIYSTFFSGQIFNLLELQEREFKFETSQKLFKASGKECRL